MNIETKAEELLEKMGIPRTYDHLVAIEATLIRAWNERGEADVKAFEEEFCGTRGADCIRNLDIEEK